MKNAIMQLFNRAFNRNKINTFDSLMPVEGIFDLKLIEKDGTVSQHIHEKNLIVNGAFDILSGLLTTGDAGKVISEIAIGDQGIVNGVYVPPYVSDQTLRNEVLRKTGFQNIMVEKVLEKTITFQWVVDYNEGNGPGAKIYNEAGLFSADGTMFSRKVFVEIVKTQEQIIVINWQLRFVEK